VTEWLILILHVDLLVTDLKDGVVVVVPESSSFRFTCTV